MLHGCNLTLNLVDLGAIALSKLLLKIHQKFSCRQGVSAISFEMEFRIQAETISSVLLHMLLSGSLASSNKAPLIKLILFFAERARLMDLLHVKKLVSVNNTVTRTMP